MENIDTPIAPETSSPAGLPFLTLGLIVAAILIVSFVAYRWFKRPAGDQGSESESDRECEGDQCQME